MKNVIALVVAAGLLGGCTYGGVAVTPNGYAVVAKSNAFLFGAFNRVFVCKVTDGGLTQCSAMENP
jgi:hypothetical protein